MLCVSTAWLTSALHPHVREAPDDAITPAVILTVLSVVLAAAPAPRLTSSSAPSASRPRARAAAQPKFDRAVALLHSFWFQAALDGFAETAKTDPGCAMAHWGTAMTLLGNPLAGPPSPEGARRGRRGGRPREGREREDPARARLRRGHRDLLPATRTRSSTGRAPSPTSAPWPISPPAIPPTRGGDLLRPRAQHHAQPERQDLREPAQGGRDPGAGVRAAARPSRRGPLPDPQLRLPADRPEGAARGAALRGHRALGAPRAAHALAHLHPRGRLAGVDRHQSRLGRRRQGGAEPPGAAGARLVQRAPRHGLHGLRLHAAGEGPARRGPSSPRSRGSASSTWSTSPRPSRSPPSPRATRSSGGSGRTRRPSSSTPRSCRGTSSRWRESITWFARGLGAARSGDAASARKDLERIVALRDRQAAAKSAYWAEQSEIQRIAVSAWIARAEGKNDEALALMRQAADREDATEKHPVTPGALFPAREMLGDMLLEVGRPADALTEFEASQRVDPNRFLGLYGAARAAEPGRQRRKARTYYSAARRARPGRRDAERPELRQGPRRSSASRSSRRPGEGRPAAPARHGPRRSPSPCFLTPSALCLAGSGARGRLRSVFRAISIAS